MQKVSSKVQLEIPVSFPKHAIFTVITLERASKTGYNSFCMLSSMKRSPKQGVYLLTGKFHDLFLRSHSFKTLA